MLPVGFDGNSPGGQIFTDRGIFISCNPYGYYQGNNCHEGEHGCPDHQLVSPRDVCGLFFHTPPMLINCESGFQAGQPIRREVMVSEPAMAWSLNICSSSRGVSCASIYRSGRKCSGVGMVSCMGFQTPVMNQRIMPASFCKLFQLAERKKGVLRAMVYRNFLRCMVICQSLRSQIFRKLMGSLGSPCDCSLMGAGPCSL